MFNDACSESLRQPHSRCLPSFLGIVNEKLHVDEKWSSISHIVGRIRSGYRYDKVTQAARTSSRRNSRFPC
ncbi:hypothetical protein ALT721_2000039 [Alteromonas alvinellae]